MNKTNKSIADIHSAHSYEEAGLYHNIDETGYHEIIFISKMSNVSFSVVSGDYCDDVEEEFALPELKEITGVITEDTLLKVIALMANDVKIKDIEV